jgi:hypothetical protein
MPEIVGTFLRTELWDEGADRGFVDKKRRQFRFAGTVHAVVDPQRAAGHGQALPGLRLLLELLGGARLSADRERDKDGASSPLLRHRWRRD